MQCSVCWADVVKEDNVATCGDPAHALCVTCAKPALKHVGEHVDITGTTAVCADADCAAKARHGSALNAKATATHRVLTASEYLRIEGQPLQTHSNHHTLACGNPITIVGVDVVCPEALRIPMATWHTHRPGTLVVACPSGFCRRRWCVDCGTAVSAPTRFCDDCLDASIPHTGSQPQNPFLWNAAARRGAFCHEVGPEAVKAYVAHIEADATGTVGCPQCGVPLEKHGGCNTLTHCGLRICFVCRKTTADPAFPASHWGDPATGACPRFDDLTPAERTRRAVLAIRRSVTRYEMSGQT